MVDSGVHDGSTMPTLNVAAVAGTVNPPVVKPG
jgi:hypothetical protein